MNKNKKIIAIVGLMGVGKTTIGMKIAKKLGYYFIDSDHEIEDHEHRSISEIFSQSGEKHFREVEKKIIKEIISRDEKIVLSLGGGAFMDDEIREILKEKTITIWFYAEVEDILHRIGHKNNRPLLNKVDKRKTLEELSAKRSSTYSEADLKFDTSSENIESLMNKIKSFTNE